jgi:hypothetical protein
MLVLRGAPVMGLLDGSDSAHAETLEIQEEGSRRLVPKPAYDTWITRDQQVVSYLTKLFSKEILPKFLDWSMLFMFGVPLKNICLSIQSPYQYVAQQAS